MAVKQASKAGGRVRAEELLASIYANRKSCPECKRKAEYLDPDQPTKGFGPIEHTAKCKTGQEAEARRADLRGRLATAHQSGEEGRKARADRRQQKEREAMASRKATAEAMTSPELKDALKELGVKGYSRLSHDDLVALYLDSTKPAKASRASSNGGEPREWAADQERIIPVLCESDDGEFSLKSGSGNWNAIKSRIGKYLRDNGGEKEDVRAALDKAKASFDGGAQSATIKAGKGTVKVKALAE